MKTGQFVPSVLVGIICCWLPFVFTGDGLFAFEFRIAGCAILVACILIGVLCLRKGISFSVTGSDIFVFLYILYGCLRVCFSWGELPYSFFPQWMMLVAGYIVSRNINSTLLPLFLWATCTLQAILALAQFMGIVGSHHFLFNGTGSFWNPSQLGGFIACFFPVMVNELLTGKYPVRYWLGLLPMACSLVLSDSRAAWLACGVGMLYVVSFKFKDKVKVGLLCLGLLLGGMVTFFYKPLSAMGRLYIWWISKDMVRENPLWGKGMRSFRDEYMLYQANYFHVHPESAFSRMATSVTTPYNEFIHVFVEQGCIGFLLLFLLFGSYFLFVRLDINMKYRGVILAFVCFACFSYPGENIALLFGLVVCMGAIRGKEWLRIRLSCAWKCVILCVLVACVTMSVGVIKEYSLLTGLAKQPLDSTRLFLYKNEPEAIQYLLHVNKSLKSRDRLRMREWLSDKMPSPETYCNLGYMYEQVQDNEEAERYYRIASNMVPNQIRANYYLFKLYERRGRSTDAREMAIVISRQDVKIENTFTLSVKGEIERFLKKSR